MASRRQAKNFGLNDDLVAALTNRFVLERSLGSGLTQTVLLAQDRELHRNVAIKILRKDAGNSNRTEPWKREVDVALGLRHPNIVAAYDFVDFGSAIGLVLQYVSGDTWAASCHGERDHESGRIGAVIALASGVEYLHGRGWVHGDLKPDNVVVDSDGQPLLCDFGSVMPVTSDEGDSVELNGTPVYLAPECAAGESLATAASDVYSLGVLLLQRISGKPPFEGSTESILDAVIHRGPPSLKAIGCVGNPRLQAILDKACHRDPAQRYRSASAFAEDLQRYLDRQPIFARRTGPFGKLLLWGRRNPVGAALCSALLVAILSGIGISALNWRLAMNERARLVESEARLVAESKILEASEVEQVMLIARIESERTAATNAEALAVSLRDAAEQVQQQRRTAVEEASRLEKDAKEKQQTLEESIAKTKAANAELSNVTGKSETERSRLEQANRSSELAEFREREAKSREHLQTAIDAAIKNEWASAEVALKRIAKEHQSYLYHRVAIAVAQESWHLPRTKIPLPFPPHKVKTTADSRYFVTLAKDGRGTCFELPEFANQSEFALVERDHPPVREVMAVGVSTDGSRFSVAYRDRKKEYFLKIFEVDAVSRHVTLTLKKPFSANIHAIRYIGDSPFALASSIDGKNIGLMDLNRSQFVWQWKPPSSKDKEQRDSNGRSQRLMLLDTRCHPLATLTFAVRASTRPGPVSIVSIDFQQQKPDVRVVTTPPIPVTSHWSAMFFVGKSLLISGSSGRAFLIEPSSLPIKNARLNSSFFWMERWGGPSRFVPQPPTMSYAYPIFGADRLMVIGRDPGRTVVHDLVQNPYSQTSTDDLILRAEQSLPMPDSFWTDRRGSGMTAQFSSNKAFLMEGGSNELILYQLSSPTPRYRDISEFRQRLEQVFPAKSP